MVPGMVLLQLWFGVLPFSWPSLITSPPSHSYTMAPKEKEENREGKNSQKPPTNVQMVLTWPPLDQSLAKRDVPGWLRPTLVHSVGRGWGHLPKHLLDS